MKLLSKAELPFAVHIDLSYEAEILSSEELQLADVVPAAPSHVQPSSSLYVHRKVIITMLIAQP